MKKFIMLMLVITLILGILGMLSVEDYFRAGVSFFGLLWGISFREIFENVNQPLAFVWFLFGLFGVGYVFSVLGIFTTASIMTNFLLAFAASFFIESMFERFW